MGGKSITTSTHVIYQNSYFIYSPYYSFTYFIHFLAFLVIMTFFFFVDAPPLKLKNGVLTYDGFQSFWHWIGLVALSSHLITSHFILSHLISLHSFLINDYWFMGGHCAGCCTLTLWNLCFQVKVGSWYRGGKRAKRDMQETKKIFTVNILKYQKNMVGGVLICLECLQRGWSIHPTLWEAEEGCGMWDRTF